MDKSRLEEAPRLQGKCLEDTRPLLRLIYSEEIERTDKWFGVELSLMRQLLNFRMHMKIKIFTSGQWITNHSGANADRLT